MILTIDTVFFTEKEVHLTEVVLRLSYGLDVFICDTLSRPDALNLHSHINLMLRSVPNFSPLKGNLSVSFNNPVGYENDKLISFLHMPIFLGFCFLSLNRQLPESCAYYLWCGNVASESRFESFQGDFFESYLPILEKTFPNRTLVCPYGGKCLDKDLSFNNGFAVAPVSYTLDLLKKVSFFS